MRLLVRERIVPEPVLPTATPAQRLQAEFCRYLQQERALASRTQFLHLTFVAEFLKERFGNRPVDLSTLCAEDVTGFVRRRAATIQSKRVQIMTTALRSFLRFVRYRGDIDKDLAACVPAIANWKLSTIPRAIPAAQVELLLSSIDRKTAVGRRDYAILLILARLGLRASEIPAFAAALAAAVGATGVTAPAYGWTDEQRAFLAALAKDLKASAGKSADDSDSDRA